MRSRITGAKVFACCCALYSGGALAEAVDDLLLSGAAVPLSELEESRGKQDLQIDINDIQMLVQKNDGEQNAILRDNVLQAGVNGDNYIATGAMNGMTGIGTVIQNTGNQVIIQDTTMVNVTIRP